MCLVYMNCVAYIIQYTCHICYFSSIVGSSEAVSCETLPPQQLKVSESPFLQQSQLCMACSPPPSLSTVYSYPLLLLPLSLHCSFLLHWCTKVLHLWRHAPLQTLGADWAWGTEQVWAVFSKLRSSLRAKVVPTCEWIEWKFIGVCWVLYLQHVMLSTVFYM